MQRLAHTIPQAAEIANSSRTQLYADIKAGKLRKAKQGRKTLILDDELRRYLRSLQVEPDALEAQGAS